MRELLRKNIAELVPYSCARNDFKGVASVFLDANENWQDFVKKPGRNRYPDPLCTRLRAEIEKRMGLKAAHTVIGNGSDEVIDNLIRMFCVPGKDHVLLLPPTYGAYRVFCDINDVKVDMVPLKTDFQLDMDAILSFLRSEKENRREGGGRLKLLFICSPNNPSANAFPLDQVEEIARNFDGITIVDEAYHDFSSVESAVSLQPRYPNLVVLRTLSKCWALAGARIGILVASEEICAVMASMKYPYNVSSPAQDAALEDMENWEKVMAGKVDILKQRPLFASALAKLPCVEKVYPSDANFLLVKVRDANKIYAYLMDKGIIVRNRSKELHCENCLRITVGNAKENQAVIDALKEWEK